MGTSAQAHGTTQSSRLVDDRASPTFRPQHPALEQPGDHPRMALNLEKQLLFVSLHCLEFLLFMKLIDFLSMELTTATQYGNLTLEQKYAWAYN